MSPAAAARARVASAVRRARPATPAPRPRLTLLAPPASTRLRLPFAALCAAVLVASLLGVLVINIVLSRGAYTEHVLESRQVQLTEDEQDLSEQLAVRASPAVLSDRARDLGMVPNVNPAFIRMSDGTVLGSPAPADAGTAPAAASIPAAGLDVVPQAPATAEQAAQAEAARIRAEADRAAAAQAAAGTGAAGTGDSAGTAPVDPAAPPVGDGAVGVGGGGTAATP